MCRSRSGVGTVCGIVCLRIDCSRNQFGGVDCFENSSRVSRGGKDPIFIQFVLSNSVCFRIALRNQLRRWLEKVHHREKSMNPHPLRIDRVKFNGTNNFGMWRCEVMDVLTASNLKDTLG